MRGRTALRSEKGDPLLRAFARSHTSLTKLIRRRLPSKFSSGQRTRWTGRNDEMEFVAFVFRTTFRNSRHVRNLHRHRRFVRDGFGIIYRRKRKTAPRGRVPRFSASSRLLQATNQYAEINLISPRININ